MKISDKHLMQAMKYRYLTLSDMERMSLMQAVDMYTSIGNILWEALSDRRPELISVDCRQLLDEYIENIMDWSKCLDEEMDKITPEVQQTLYTVIIEGMRDVSFLYVRRGLHKIHKAA